MTVAKATVRKSKITIPERCHPLAKVVFAEMQRQAVTYDELEWRSGVLRSTFKAWRTSNLPSIPTIEAALGVVGYDLLPVPKPDRLDPALRADLEAVAAKHGLDVIPNRELVASCVGYHPHPGAHIDARERRKAA
jgi:hypothetical protein